MTTVNGTGWFQTNGVGGNVTYEWLHQDKTGTVAAHRTTLYFAPGNKSQWTVTPDSWTPASSGSDYLLIVSPSGSTLTPFSFTCR